MCVCVWVLDGFAWAVFCLVAAENAGHGHDREVRGHHREGEGGGGGEEEAEEIGEICVRIVGFGPADGLGGDL